MSLNVHSYPNVKKTVEFISGVNCKLIFFHFFFIIFIVCCDRLVNLLFDSTIFSLLKYSRRKKTMYCLLFRFTAFHVPAEVSNNHRMGLKFGQLFVCLSFVFFFKFVLIIRNFKGMSNSG